MPHMVKILIYPLKRNEPLCNICIGRKPSDSNYKNEPVGHYYSGKTDTTPVKASILLITFPKSR